MNEEGRGGPVCPPDVFAGQMQKRPSEFSGGLFYLKEVGYEVGYMDLKSSMSIFSGFPTMPKW